MLEAIRKASKTWVVAAFIGLIAISFAVWGIEDVFRGPVDTTIATVGEREITIDAFQDAFDLEVRQLRREVGGSITADQARQLGLDRQVLDRLVGQAAIATVADEMRIRVPDSAVVAEVQEIPAFRNGVGAFDREQMIQVLRQNQMTEQMFVEQVRRDLQQNQVLGALAAGVRPPAGMSDLFLQHQNERRVVSFFRLAPEKAGEIPAPDDGQLQALIDLDAPRYTRAETRSATLVVISADTLATSITIDETQAREAFEAQRSRWEQPERRTLEQIRFPDRETAVAAHERLKGGTDFIAVAAEQGLAAEDLALGELTREGLAPALADAAFAVAANGFTEPVEGPFGWVILRATAVVPGVTKTFDDVRGEIEQALARDEARARLFDVTTKFEDARGAGATLEDAAREAGVAVVQTGPIRSDGTLESGERPAGLPDVPAIVGRIFELEQAQDDQLQEAPNEVFFVARVDGIAPAELKPLDTVREEATAAWRAQELRARLRRMAEDLTQRISAGLTLEAAAAELGATVETTAPIGRAEAETPFAQEALAELFSVRQGVAISGPERDGEGFVIAKPVQVITPPLDVPQALEARERAAEQFRTMLSNDIGLTFVRAAEAAGKATVNETVFARTRQTAQE